MTQGEAIHHNRTMVNCTFLDGGCQGQVHNKFQQAFEEVRGRSIHQSARWPQVCHTTQSNLHTTHNSTRTQLIAKCWTDVGPLRGRRVYVTGHSLGGGMSVFMSIKLWKVMDQIPLVRMCTEPKHLQMTNSFETNQPPPSTPKQDLGTLPVMTLGWAGPFVGYARLSSRFLC